MRVAQAASHLEGDCASVYAQHVGAAIRCARARHQPRHGVSAKVRVDTHVSSEVRKWEALLDLII